MDTKKVKANADTVEDIITEFVHVGATADVHLAVPADLSVAAVITVEAGEDIPLSVKNVRNWKLT